MALEVGKNTYLTLEEAQSLAQSELDSDSTEYKLWTSLSDADKEAILKRGTMDINTLPFKGSSLKYKYELKFPRLINGKEQLPEAIKIAVLIQGLMSKLATSSKYYELVLNGVESMTVGPNSIKMNASRFNGIKIHERAMAYIEPYIKRSGG